MTPGQKQNMARVERYKLLVSTAQNLKADAVCVAHHKDVRSYSLPCNTVALCRRFSDLRDA
jgi:hypothetical protein